MHASSLPPPYDGGGRGGGEALLSKLPLHFEPAASDGEFIARGRSFLLGLDDSGATLHLKHGDEFASLGMQLVGAQPASAHGEDKLQGVSNYFLGADRTQWRAGVPHYRRVKYEAVYPGVDLVYYGAGRDLEYDFIVAPGADPKQIKLSYRGAQDVRIDAAGDLRIAVEGGDVVHRKPVVYQTLANGVRASVAGAFRLVKSATDAASAVVAFDLGDYDARLPLVIDPVLTYSSYLGSADNDEIVAIAVDAAGAVYVTGETESASFPTTAGAVQTVHGSPGGSELDVFVAKINSQGTALEYSTFLGGDNQDFAAAIEIDGAGTAYLAGTTNSTNFPTASAFDTTHAGGAQTDLFVARLNAQGAALLYSTYLGGARNEGSSNGGSNLALRVDASGSAYLLSTTESNDYPVTAGAPQANRAGDPLLFADDFVITKLAANGASLLFSTYLGGVSEEELGHGHERARGGLHITDAGLVTVMGATGAGFPTTAGVVQTTHGGSEDAVIARINTATNAVVFATYLGGSGFERMGGSAIDASGAIYVCGETQGPNYPTTAGAFDTTAADRDVFMTKLNSTATTLLYSTLLGGASADYDPMCRIDAAGAAYIGGSTGSTDFPATPGAFDTTNDSDQGFIAKLNATGTALIYASYLADELDFLEIDAAGEAYLAWRTANDSLLVTPGGRPYANNEEAYFLHLSASGGTGLDASYLGGSGEELMNDFVLAASGDLYIAGATESDDFFTTPGAVQTTSGNAGGNSDSDGFIARFAMGDGSSQPPTPQPGVVQFSAASFSVNENGGSVTLTLTRTNGADGAISVSVASGGGSAAAGSDYTALTQTVNWANGDATAKTVALTIANDSTDEPDETVSVALSNATGGATLGATSSATVTIVDDDPAVVTPPAPTPPQAPGQASSARGSYGGGALNWVLMLALAALAVGRTARADEASAGWFVGVRGGIADSTLDAPELARSLAARGHTVEVSLDEEEATWTLFGGYRWSSGLGLEASVIDLGEYDVSLTGVTNNSNGLLTAVQSLLADAGRGAGASLSWRWAITDRLSLTPRAGAYYWESARVLTSSGQRFRRSENGVNLMGGVAFGLEVTSAWSVALGWDAYDAGSRNDVRAYSASVEYRF